MEDDLKWNDYVLDDYHFTDFPPGSLVVDVGCGYGDLLERLTKQGCRAIGVEVDEEAIAQCRSRGLRVLKAPAEALPMANASMDGGICKGVLPYTDEAQAFAELRRVVKTGGRIEAMYLGSGYYARYLLLGPSLRRRFYGSRSLLNTLVHNLSGRLLPGWLGDTIYQSPARLSSHYSQHGFKLLRATSSKKFMGWPVFIYHSLEKQPG